MLRTQSPDLNRIVEVLANAAATEELRRSRNLERAYEEVVPKAARFVEALYETIRSAERAAGLHASYDGDPVHLEAAKNLFITVRGLRDNMRKKAEGDDE